MRKFGYLVKLIKLIFNRILINGLLKFSIDRIGLML